MTLSVAFLATAATVAAGASIYQGFQARDQAEFQVEESERMAQQAHDAAQSEELNRRRQLRRQLGQMRATAAAQGVSLTGDGYRGEGSLGALTSDAEGQARLDIRNIQRIGDAQVQGYLAQGRQARKAGKSAFLMGFLGAGFSLSEAGYQYATLGSSPKQQQTTTGIRGSGLSLGQRGVHP